MLHYDAWQGIKALAEYNSKQASHARVSLLFYLAMRASSEYIWGSLENIAADNALSKEACGRLMRDLENVGAIELTPHHEIPPHIRAMIETSYALKPAKKVWRVTGTFCIEDVTYQYLYKGDGASNVGKPNNPNIGNSKYWKSQPNIIEIKDKEDKEEKITTLSDAHASGEETQLPTAKPKRTVISRKSPEYIAIEAAVQSKIYHGGSLDMQGGTICSYLVIKQITPTMVEKFVLWWKAKYPNADVPRQIQREKGTDNFQGKFVSRLEEWLLTTQAKTKAPTPGSEAPPSPVLPVLSAETIAANVAMLKGGAK